MKLVICSTNLHKLQEIKDLLAEIPITVLSINEWIKNPPLIIEDGQTFEENALKKVHPLPAMPDVFYLSDDSGLSVDALEGRPGIHSARYGNTTNTTEQCQKLLQELSNIPHRNAAFHCVLALKTPEGTYKTFKGHVSGTISTTIEGQNGFGYDPIFIPEGYSQTYANLPENIKSATSHRSQALQKFKLFLKDKSKFTVDQSCIACDTCVGLAPKHFALNSNNDQADVVYQPTTDEEIKHCQEALEACPVQAILKIL